MDKAIGVQMQRRPDTHSQFEQKRTNRLHRGKHNKEATMSRLESRGEFLATREGLPPYMHSCAHGCGDSASLERSGMPLSLLNGDFVGTEYGDGRGVVRMPTPLCKSSASGVRLYACLDRLIRRAQVGVGPMPPLPIGVPTPLLVPHLGGPPKPVQ